MHVKSSKLIENSQNIESSTSKDSNSQTSVFQFTDNRLETKKQRKMQNIINSSSKVKQLQVIENMANVYASKHKNSIQKMKNISNNDIQTIQMVKINDKEINSMDDMYEGEYEELLESLESLSNSVDIFRKLEVAIENKVEMDINGENDKELLDAMLKAIEEHNEYLTKLLEEEKQGIEDRKAEMRKNNEQKGASEVESREASEVESREASEVESREASEIEGIRKGNLILEQEIGKITKIIERTHKYIAFSGQRVVAIAKPEHIGELKNEFASLTFLNKNNCSSVQLLSPIFPVKYGKEEEDITSVYIMEELQGLHSKQDNQSFKRTLYDMEEDKKHIARQDLENIKVFSNMHSIGDLQLMLMENGSVKVLDPLGIKEGASETNIFFINEMISMVEQTGERPDDKLADKKGKAD